MNIDDAAVELGRINWSFPSTGTREGSIHTLHRFAGNFIPQIPEHLIQILSSPGELVFDPFVGSGTTVVEALRLGRNSLGVDRTRACVFITQAKINVLRVPLNASLRQSLAGELAWSHLCHTGQYGLEGEGSNPELCNWFSPATLSQLRFLWRITEAADPEQRDLLRLIFSDVLFSCASTGNALTSGGKPRRHHWGWIADNVRPSELAPHDAASLFLERLLATKSMQVSEIPRGVEGHVSLGDARSLHIESNSVDLIVTSPPYAGMIDYALAHRLLYLWMNWDLSADREAEIGARYKRKRLNLLGEYLSDIERCWHEMIRVLKPGRACAIILGESRKFPGAAMKAFQAMESIAPKLWGPVERIPIRRRVSDRLATEPVEFVAVFTKR